MAQLGTTESIIFITGTTYLGHNIGKRRSRATIGMLLFIADLAAALWMAYNLHKLCHKNYAFAVFALAAMPGKHVTF